MIKLITFKYFRRDMLGGITAGIVALPLALAFGVSSGLGPSAGLYGAIIVGFFAALFGGTNTQISGPTAPMTAVSMVVVTGIIASFGGELDKALPIILTVFLLAGLIQIALGAMGIGKYIRYIPYPVVSGFMTAIGVIIIITQLLPSLGYYPKEDMAFVNQFKPQAEEIILDQILKEEAGEGVLVLENFKTTIDKAKLITPEQILKESKTLAGKESSGVLGSLKVLPNAWNNLVWIEIILAIITIITIYGFEKITRKIPGQLVALFVITGIAYGFNLNYRSIEAIPGGIPVPNLGIFTNFDLTSVTPYIFMALTLALLGAIDSLLTSIVADNMTKTRHRPNKELIGQGIGNSIAAFFGGLPGAGATIRTVVNIRSGGKTRLSGMIASILLLIILLVLSPIASKIPAAVLAGILITVGIGVMDYKGLKAIPNMPRSEVTILIIVLILSSIWNLVFAVGIGLVLASFIFMKKIGDLSIQNSEVKSLDKLVLWNDEKNFPEELSEKIFIKHINGPLFFGSSSEFHQLAKQIPETASSIIFRMDKMPYIDQSGLYTLEDIVMDFEKEKKNIYLVGLNKQPAYMFERIDIIPDLIPEEHVFSEFDDCLEYIKKQY